MFKLPRGIPSSLAVVTVGLSFAQILPADAFSYLNGVATDLGNVTPVAINDAGQILESVGSKLYLVQGNNSIQIGLPGSTSDNAGGLNDSGQVVGISYLNGSYHPFLYSGGTVSDLSGFLSAGREAIGILINSSGQVLLTSSPTPYLPNSPSYDAVLITNGVSQDMGSFQFPGQTPLQFEAFNKNDTILGFSGVPPYGDSPYNSFFINSGQLTNFASIAPSFNFSSTIPLRINDLGQVIGGEPLGNVGYFYDNGTFTTLGYEPIALSNNGAFIAGFEPGKLILNGTEVNLTQALSEGPGIFAYSVIASGVNDQGEVIGTFQTFQIPEPGSFSMILVTAMGGAIIFGTRRAATAFSKQFFSRNGVQALPLK